MKCRGSLMNILLVFLAASTSLNTLPAGILSPSTALAGHPRTNLVPSYVASDGQLSGNDVPSNQRDTLGGLSSALVRQNGQLEAPVITGFHPTHGRPGDTVNITGANFLLQYPGDTAVDFSGVPAEVLSITENETRVIVPLAAITGPIRVRTPAGEAMSESEFAVLFMRTIQLQLPAGLSAVNYTVVNPYGYARPTESRATRQAEGNTVSMPSSDQDVNSRFKLIGLLTREIVD